jgi:hypothetical protein
MRGGANNYRPNAPMVDRLGSGFFVRGKVLRAGDGAPLKGLRIQIWAATVLGGEPDPVNHGSVLTRADGSFELEMAQIVPNFGQPHAHLAYDDGAFQTVFLRPVMPSARDTVRVRRLRPRPRLIAGSTLMGSIGRRRVSSALAWGSVAAVMIVPVAIAAFSPYLASRNMPYIVGGFAGIVGLSLLFLQPLLPAGYLAGSEGPAGRRWHRWLGVAIVVAVALHVGRALPG